jgi:hypothetical protein
MRVISRGVIHLAPGFEVEETVGIEYDYRRKSVAVGTVTKVDDDGRILDWHFEYWVDRGDV